MRISCNWLADYVQTDWTPEELAERLTMSGLEVESVDPMGATLEGVIVGHVVAVTPHPNADRLRVCRVDLGDGVPVQIVCGAPNVAEGQRVPVATVGTVLQLPDRNDPASRVSVTLKKSKIRGEESNGMICAEDELGLGTDHDGIMVLGSDARPGQPFAEYLASTGQEISDISIDISITPNRPDAICHLGVARDVAALAGRALHRPDVRVPSAGGEAATRMKIAIAAPDGCHRYVAMIVRGISVGDSPTWMQSRLEAAGLRPVNNIVDITNYVMLECGQPLHAFDLEHVNGAQITVRRTVRPDKFTTLDGKERDLPVGTLMIADGARDVAVAGVMGGENSEVSAETRDVLIESAWFNPVDIRKAAKALQLQTDASYRFERGVDPTGQAWAAARAAELMAKLAGGEIVGGMVDAHPTPWQATSVTLRAARISMVLGTEIPEAETERLLGAIGFETTRIDGGWNVSIPPFRPDVEREIDLIEEVARLYGLEEIPIPTHGSVPNDRPAPPRPLPVRTRLADSLLGMGFREICTNSMMRLDRAEQFADGAIRGGIDVGGAVATLNPISQEMAALRPSLLPGALQVVAHNLNHGQVGIRTFEFGHVFDRQAQAESPIPGYREVEHLLMVASGLEGQTTWSTTESPSDIFGVKGAVQTILDQLGLGWASMDPAPAGSSMTAYHLDVRLGKQPIGTIGCLAETIASDFGIGSPVFFAELDFTALIKALGAERRAQYQEVSRFPVVDRDIALLVERSQPVGDLLQTVRRAGGKLLKSERVFDLYQGDRIEAGKKSVAIALQFAADRTLKDQEVDKAVEKILSALSSKHGAALRT